MDAEHPTCPFCPDNSKVNLLFKSNVVYVIQVLVADQPQEDRYFIIPTQHVESIFELLAVGGWQESMLEAMEFLKEHLGPRFGDFNLNLNEGPAAGQRVMHLHWWFCLRTESPGSKSHGLGLSTLITIANNQS
jgi:diadenosine tetraphosphate (Ap4A) HIT family hydrolase